MLQSMSLFGRVTAYWHVQVDYLSGELQKNNGHGDFEMLLKGLYLWKFVPVHGSQFILQAEQLDSTYSVMDQGLGGICSDTSPSMKFVLR